MSLSTRLSLFFLAALAAVLLGFSATLYLLGRSYLWRQLDDRLEKALDTLEAAVDVESGGLEWEPEDRRLTLGLDASIENVRWLVQNESGGLVDCSPNARNGVFPRAELDTLPDLPGDATALGDLPGWRIARRHLRLDELLRLGKGHPEDDGPGDDVEYRELVLLAGLSPAPVETSLHRLAVALAGVSTTLWMACAALGRWLCRRALEPVVRMAAAARAMAAADGSDAIPIPSTGDELEDLGRAFNELLAHRHEALERQRKFAGNASHQLRTPLAGLLSLVEVVRRRPRPAGEYEQALDQVHREANRLRQIIESLLFLARSESEAAPPEAELIELTRWVPAQLRRWSEHARSADLQCDRANGPVWVCAHPLLLAQALENLLDNALKYSDPGTPVTVACRREAGQSLLTVSDRGWGLTGEEAAAIFEPFYRSLQARRQGRPGVGLGLSVVRRIVDAAGGTIEVESVPGCGTRFVLRFPEPESLAAVPPRSTVAARPAEGPGGGTARALSRARSP